ncbi:MAG: hypothetical protein UHD09_07200 [Bifidobacterium sp.]|nr:hypothetical protein [Bifidobacterium sp.]
MSFDDTRFDHRPRLRQSPKDQAGIDEVAHETPEPMSAHSVAVAIGACGWDNCLY